jgi:hypothetical protein
LVYHYFPSKEKNFRNLLDSALEIPLNALAAIFDGPGAAWKKIENLSVNLVNHSLSGEGSLYFFFVLQAMTQGKGIPGVRRQLDKRITAYSEKFIPVLIQAQKLGEAVQGDASLAPAGKGVIKVELFTRPSYFSRLSGDRAAYQAEKDRIGDQVIPLLEKQFPGLREDNEVINVPTLLTWERYMGGTEGFDNFPKTGNSYIYLTALLGLEKNYSLPGLKNFYFAGGWVTSVGALFLNAHTGKTAVQNICEQSGLKFVN